MHFSGVVLHGFEADNSQVLQIAIREALVFVLVSCADSAADVLSWSENADLHIVADGLVVLVPIPDRLAR